MKRVRAIVELVVRWLLMVLSVVVACGGESTTPARCINCSTPDSSVLALCDLCAADSDCASGICRMYGDGYRKCSTTCTPAQPAPQCTAADSGSCNNMGYCMCPQYQPPSDAGSEPRDAPMAVTAP